MEALHLWWTRTPETLDPRDLDTLSADERARCARFHFERHRAEFARAHSLVRRTLSRYAGVRPEAWQFRTGEFGKPEVAAPVSGLFFNLTHTAGLAACVVGSIAEIGVDAESLVREAAPMDIARRFFAPREVEWLENLADEERRDGFFRIWTLKEAYVKGTGRGIADISEVDVLFGRPHGWSFFEITEIDGYRLAVAVHDAEASVTVSVG